MNKTTKVILICLWILVVYIVIINFIIYSTTSPYHLYDYELGGTLEGGITKSLTALLTYGLIIGTATIFIFLAEYLGKGKEVKTKSNKSKKPTFWFRLIMLGIFTFISLPWIFALNGLYISDIPGLNLVFLAREPGIGPYISEKEKIYPAVHLGEHHGLSGFMLILFSILLSFIVYKMRDKRIKFLSIFGLGIMSFYGVISVLEDYIREQVLKRGIYFILYDSTKFLYEFNILFSLIFGAIFFFLNYFSLQSPR